MYKEFRENIKALLKKDRTKKDKYQEVLKELDKKIKKLKDKDDKDSKNEIKSLEKLAKKTKLLIDSLHED